MLEITYKAWPLRVLRRMQPKTARQIQARINAVAADPSSPDLSVRPLVGRPGFRLRVGTWRIIFVIEADGLKVLAIEPRGQAYKPRRLR
jgi:mRNA interferase RelE/StbE